jgi:hypothetical protein
MNLADWLQGDHEPSERLKAVETLCRAVSDSSKSLDLDPAHIQMSGNECRPSEGKAVPSGRYRAPEMAQGGPPVPQSQVFTVGVLCFEILSGRSFEARGGPLLRDLRPDLPRDLSDAVQACLEMDAEWRPKDLSYLLGLVDALATSGASGAKPAARGGRSTPASPTPTNRARRSGPAPRSGPLLVFALVALAVSVATAVVRLRQPIEPPPLPPAASSAPLPSPAAREGIPQAAVSPSTIASRPSTSGPALPVAASPPRGSGAPAPSPIASPTARPAVAPTPSVPAAVRVPSPAVTAAPAVVPTAAAPTPGPAASAPAVSEAARPAEPGAPAAVTNVSPPILHRGAQVLVDVHGVGLRSDHQVRLTRGREAVRGIEVMRQRYVGPTLLQVLLKVDAAAPTGAYAMSLVDGGGTATNARSFEVAK